MGKLLKFRRRRDVDSMAERQRQWLERHPEVAVVGRWEWPRGTWLQRRIVKIRGKNSCK